MLRLYPSNKLEHLANLLDAVMRHTRAEADGPVASVLAPNSVLVESLGMQHWLNMALAERQGIAMNLQFPMPTRFMWQIARQVLGNQMIPEQSSYKREVLTWRIYDLIQSEALVSLPDNAPIAHYFQQLTKHSNEDDLPAVGVAAIVELSEAKKLQFCRSLADVYEQYMLYRPDWLFAWENKLSVATGQPGISELDEGWQASLWRALVSQQALHPASLHKLTIETLAIGHKQDAWKLPRNVFVFALNTMAPQLVSFLNALAIHCDVHIFHLNPCVNYWGELQTEKQALRQGINHKNDAVNTQIDQWINDKPENPLLSNLGQQGRDLFNLLQQQPSYEVSAFDAPIPDALDDHNDHSKSLLSQVQQAIFEGRNQPSEQFQICSNDPSVTIVKAHSALRELQGLHDFLLESMNSDTSLLPRDILVMCPAIENYAAFIPSVFSTSRDMASEHRIPCSVADRSPLDSMPEVSSFLTLLDIPQSRFEISSIIDYLRLPAIQKRFGIIDTELDVIVRWMSNARIHWGLNAAHKQRFVDTQQLSQTNTWEWGLQRLLIGFAQIDERVLQNDMLTLPDAEGQQTEILGKLCLLLEQLQWHLSELKQPRNISEWQEYLLQLRERFFHQDDSNDRAIAILERGIGELVNHSDMAHYNGSISIFVLRDALSHSFTAPDAINQFMTGQVTFCSMLPMRSIPFKVIAMLGLNDGDFPRLSTPFSIDLMQSAPRKLGDRSRRGDDRYLFLESIVSARQMLYLSYQSNSVKDNSERQPSLVLREFRDYLQQSFGDLDNPEKTAYKAYSLPLHAFHAAHFARAQDAVIPSYDNGWLRLAKQLVNSPEVPQEAAQYRIKADPVLMLSSAELTKALTDPLKYFAHHALGLYLDTNEPELLDSEPFSIDGLSRYKLLSALNEAEFEPNDPDYASNFERTMAEFVADGSIPNDVVSQSIYTAWLSSVRELQLASNAYQTETKTVLATCQGITLDANFRLTLQEEQPLIVESLVNGGKNQHHLKMRINQLIASLAFEQPIAAKMFYLGTSNKELKCYTCDYPGFEPDTAMQVLSRLCSVFSLIQSSPQLFHCDLGSMLAKHIQKDTDWVVSNALSLAWEKAFQATFGNEKDTHSPLKNSYLEWFFPSIPALEYSHALALLECYQPIFDGLKPVVTNKKTRAAKA